MKYMKLPGGQKYKLNQSYSQIPHCTQAIQTKQQRSWIQNIIEVNKISRPTDYFKKVSKQEDFLGGPGLVGPVAKQRPRDQATQAERRQGQTQEVRSCI